MSYTVSCRQKIGHLKTFISLIPDVDSVFGFTEPCKMYGGRPYNRDLTDYDIEWAYSQGIGYRIPMQNTLVDKKEYDLSKSFLEKYHRKGNSIILARDRFIPCIREEFPLYEIEASVIKRINTVESVISNLERYDTVVPDPAWINHQPELIPEEYRSRVRLFANAGCMYTCPQRICYTAISKMHLGIGKYECSANKVSREYKGSMYDFDVAKFKTLGYTKFKLLRSNGYTGF